MLRVPNLKTSGHQCRADSIRWCAIRTRGAAQRRRSGDFGRLDEEIDAIVSVGLNYEIVPACILRTRGCGERTNRLDPSRCGAQCANCSPPRLATISRIICGIRTSPQRNLVFIWVGNAVKPSRTFCWKSFAPDTPVIMVFGASWSEEAIVRLTLSELAHDQTQPPRRTVYYF